MLGEQDQQPGRVAIRGGSHRQPGAHPLRQEPVGIGRAHPLGHARPYELELLDLAAAEQAMTARIAVRHHQRVALLPGAEGGNRHADHARYGADAVNRAAARSLHVGHPSRPPAKASSIKLSKAGNPSSLLRQPSPPTGTDLLRWTAQTSSEARQLLWRADNMTARLTSQPVRRSGLSASHSVTWC